MGSWIDQAATLAYHILAEEAPAALPVDVAALIRSQSGTELLTYAQAALILDLTPDQWRWEAPSPDAFTLIEHQRTPARYKIFYDETKPLTRQRFTLAHELGHLLFHQLGDASTEAAVDCFARHLLCPPVLMHGLPSQPLQEAWLCRTFGLSPAAVARLLKSPCGQVDPTLAHQVRAKFTPVITR